MGLEESMYALTNRLLRLRVFPLLLPVLLISALCPLLAGAAPLPTLSFSETGVDGDTLNVTCTGVCPGVLSPSTVEVASPNAPNFAEVDYTLAATDPFTPFDPGKVQGLILVESAGDLMNPNAVYSDLIQFLPNVVSNTAYGEYRFVSFIDQPPIPLIDCSVLHCRVETGRPQDVSGFFFLSSGSILVQSDVESVPKPASILLLAITLAALRCTRGKRD
jgi:hypothetical protein